MPEEQIQVEDVKTVAKGTTGFSFEYPTPLWATWVFRIEFFLNKALLLWLSSTDVVPEGRMKVWVGTLAAIDFFVWGIGRSLGVKPPEQE